MATRSQRSSARSRDVLRVEEGSLYPALHRMEEAGVIKARWAMTDKGRRARINEVTATGRAARGRGVALARGRRGRRPRLEARLSGRGLADVLAVPPRQRLSQLPRRRRARRGARFHLESTTDALIAAACRRTRRPSRRASLRQCPPRLRERSRDVKLLSWRERLGSDLGFAVRLLRRMRRSTVAVVVSLGLAMGACAAAFMLVDALVFRALPVREPNRLVYLTFAESPSQTGKARRSAIRSSNARGGRAGRVDRLLAGYRECTVAASDAPGREERGPRATRFGTCSRLSASGPRSDGCSRFPTIAERRPHRSPSSATRTGNAGLAARRRRLAGFSRSAGSSSRSSASPARGSPAWSLAFHRRVDPTASSRRRADRSGPIVVPHVGQAGAGSDGRGSPATPAAGHDPVSPRACSDVPRRRAR